MSTYITSNSCQAISNKLNGVGVEVERTEIKIWAGKHFVLLIRFTAEYLLSYYLCTEIMITSYIVPSLHNSTEVAVPALSWEDFIKIDVQTEFVMFVFFWTKINFTALQRFGTISIRWEMKIKLSLFSLVYFVPAAALEKITCYSICVCPLELRVF